MTSFLPLMHGIKTDICEPDEMLQNSDCRKKLYFLDGFLEEMKYLLPRFEEEGFLE